MFIWPIQPPWPLPYSDFLALYTFILRQLLWASNDVDGFTLVIWKPGLLQNRGILLLNWIWESARHAHRQGRRAAVIYDDKPYSLSWCIARASSINLKIWCIAKLHFGVAKDTAFNIRQSLICSAFNHSQQTCLILLQCIRKYCCKDKSWQRWYILYYWWFSCNGAKSIIV